MRSKPYKGPYTVTVNTVPDALKRWDSGDLWRLVLNALHNEVQRRKAQDSTPAQAVRG